LGLDASLRLGCYEMLALLRRSLHASTLFPIAKFVSAGNLQSRGIISVDVVKNQGEKALRTLKRKVIEEGFKETWLKQSVFTKPSQERKIAAGESAKRLRKRAFKEKLRWIMRRNARGF
jgi:ribosomal protein S21